MLYVIALCLIAIYIASKIYTYINLVILVRKVPGPKRHFLFGNTPDVLVSDHAILFKKLRAWALQFYPVYSLMIMPMPSLQIVGPEDAELLIATMKHSTKSSMYDIMRNWLGDGLLTSAGRKWQNRRKLLTPAFHFNILQGFIGVFLRETTNLVEELQSECGKNFTNVVPLISQFTLQAINETSMGTTLDSKNVIDEEYKYAVHEIGKTYLTRYITPWFYYDFFYYNFTKLGRFENKLVKIMHTFTNKVIDSKVKKSEESGKIQEFYSSKKRKAMLDLLIDIKNQDGDLIDLEGIREEVSTFMFEGHDTTATSLCFTLMLLANHRHIQDLIVDEINQVFKPNDEPNYQNLQDLKYMERCIKESLRLYPSVPTLSRYIDKEGFVTSTGYNLPANTIVLLHIYDLHRNPDLYPDPSKFDPDRFLPENSHNRHPFAYIPFSAGPRNCIGQKFAMLELKTCLWGILKNFILEPVDTPETIELIPDIVLRWTNKTGIRVKFVRRL